MKVVCHMIGLLLIVSSTAAAEPANRDIEAGELAFLKNRQAIDEIHCKVRYVPLEGKKKKLVPFQMEFWASGEKYRRDFVQTFRITDTPAGSEYKPEIAGVSVRKVVCMHCEKPGKVFVGDDQSRLVKHNGSFDKYKYEIEEQFHPRLIGSIGNSLTFLCYHKLSDYYNPPDRKKTTITNEKLDGIDTAKVVWVNARGVEISMWLQPNQGYFPLQFLIRSIQESADPNKVPFSIINNYQIEPAAGNKTLLPRKVVYKDFDENAQLIRGEEVYIDEIEIGNKIDPSRFTMADFNLGNTFVLQRDGSKKTELWQAETKSTIPMPAERLRPASPNTNILLTTPLVDEPTPADPPRKSWPMVLACGLIAFAVWFIARIVAKRRTST